MNAQERVRQLNSQLHGQDGLLGQLDVSVSALLHEAQSGIKVLPDRLGSGNVMLSVSQAIANAMREGKTSGQNAARYSNKLMFKQQLDSVEEQMKCGRTQEALVGFLQLDRQACIDRSAAEESPSGNPELSGKQFFSSPTSHHQNPTLPAQHAPGGEESQVSPLSGELQAQRLRLREGLMAA
eukprot:CAMPEP_0118947564 /NCGR_PEP_ID=MMETSP1169-20130426/46278_1 /TAXON_ID=36882 /ORGANISM="Pyramimonas obovata, Strain CCMP722" /LENGTH=181 /DNA_ID=CAMNT_0006893811 /DNA_START=218 /DNA_END=759 /DNA_ORIENTATION=-